MAYMVTDVTPASFTPSRRTKRRDDEHGGDDDFARWMSGAETANDAETPKRPLTQRPMTSMEDLLLLARAREQIESSQILNPLEAYTALEPGTALIDSNQYAFDFMIAAAHVDTRI